MQEVENTDLERFQWFQTPLAEDVKLQYTDSKTLIDNMYKVDRMILIMFGPPGSGKGTYASRLKPILNVEHISTGDFFRDEIKKETELGKKVQAYIVRGELVPDDIVIEVTKNLINDPNSHGYLLDGVIRTITQAKAFEKVAKIDGVIKLNVPDEIIIKRLSARVQCRDCSAIYNTLTLKPKEEGKCDKCGGELYQRNDDKPDAIKHRLEIYRKQSEPIIKYYKGKVPFVEVVNDRLDTPPEEIVGKIMKGLREKGIIKGETTS